MRKKALRTLLLIALLVVNTIPAEATRPESCTPGDAMSLFEAFPIPPHIMMPRGLDQPKLIDTFAECQYRVFFDGRTYTFSEDDVFLGGINWIWDYKTFGISREDAIADLESIQDRVWLAEVLPGGEIGELVEQPLMHTSYKSLESARLGLIVYQHRAFITQLPAGEYVSIWESTYPGEETLRATVHLVITPTETAP